MEIWEITLDEYAVFDQKTHDQLGERQRPLEKAFDNCAKKITRKTNAFVPPSITRDINDHTAQRMSDLQSQIAEIVKQRVRLFDDLRQKRSEHRISVEQALAEGKKVPEKVLADYVIIAE